MIFLSLGIFIGYLIWVIVKFGVPESLSNTYYLMERSNLFTVTLATVSLLLLPSIGVLGFPIIGTLLVVACAPRFKEFEKSVHLSSAIIAMILAQVYVGIEGRWWLTVGLLFPWWLSKKNWLFWLELVCFLEIYTNEILKQI